MNDQNRNAMRSKGITRALPGVALMFAAVATWLWLRYEVINGVAALLFLPILWCVVFLGIWLALGSSRTLQRRLACIALAVGVGCGAEVALSRYAQHSARVVLGRAIFDLGAGATREGQIVTVIGDRESVKKLARLPYKIAFEDDLGPCHEFILSFEGQATLHVDLCRESKGLWDIAVY